MDTIMTLIPIVVAILSGLWVAYHRKHKTPWIKTWLKVIAVLIGLPVCAYMGAKGLGLTDANVKWLIGPLTLMLFSGIASVVGAFGYGVYCLLSNQKHHDYKYDDYEDDEENHPETVAFPNSQSIRLAGYFNETDYILSTGDHSAIGCDDDD